MSGRIQTRMSNCEKRSENSIDFADIMPGWWKSTIEKAQEELTRQRPELKLDSPERLAVECQIKEWINASDSRVLQFWANPEDGINQALKGICVNDSSRE
jgi:hypothetical protein